jgi:2-amino-4-hydroxy-6-hydroxymethyldihydropteridine diphosphokinase
VRVAIALGANQGEPPGAFARALAALSRDARVLARSRLYRTAPVGPPQPDYINAAALLETELPPGALLERLLALERAEGRDRAREIPGGPRPLDLDLLLYGDLCIDSAPLVVPHPRMHQRRFVLAPLSEIAPGLVHPGSGETIAALLAALGPPAEGEIALVGGLG